MIRFLDPRNWRKKPVAVSKPPSQEAPEDTPPMKLNPVLMERLNAMDDVHDLESIIAPVRQYFEVQAYAPPAGVAPNKHVLAMDSALNYANVAMSFTGAGFPGFTYLSELTQYTEYRDMSERVAAEMARKWIKLRSTSDRDRSDVIKKLDEELRRLNVRDHFRKCAEMDGLMGRAQLFIDLGVVAGPELEKPLLFDKIKISKGQLRGFKLIEPSVTYPGTYNSNNPMDPRYYNPQTWYVMGQQVHVTRLLTFVSRPLPDMLKPAYNFSGMSLSQLAQPYVENWWGTRDAVARLVRNFSTSILKTNMQSVITGKSGGSELFRRAKLFTKMRDNQGLFLLDNGTESFEQVNTPLSGLNLLQAQAQEHMAAVAKTPLVVLLGISPTGLNASSEGEIRAFYDYIADQQEKLFRGNLESVLKLAMLNLFGEIYDDITFEFVSLYNLSDVDKSTIRKQDAETGGSLISSGVIAADEERARIAKDPNSGYDNLDLNRKIEKPNPLGPGIPVPGEGGDGKKPEPPAKKTSDGAKDSALEGASGGEEGSGVVTDEAPSVATNGGAL